MAVSASLSSWIVSVLVIWIVYLVILVFYRLFLHPLAGFPGPKHAAISRWHEVYHDVVRKGQFTFVIQDYHRQYGPIVRIAPEEIHIQDSQFYDTLYTKAGRVEKYQWMAGRFGSESSMLTSSSPDVHLIRRNALNPFFSRARIISLESVIRGKIDLLLTKIGEYARSGEPFTLSKGFMAFAGDVIMQYCFSLNYGHLNSDGFTTNFHETFMAASISGLTSIQFPIIPKILFALPESWLASIEPLYALVFKMQKDFGIQVRALKEDRAGKAEAQTVPTVFRELLDNPTLPEDQKADRRMQDEAQVVVAAGITTVGWAASVGSFHIINNPDISRRLRQELLQAIPDSTMLPQWSDLEKLPYLTGCIREAIRLSYPVSTRNPRLLSKPLTYGKWVIPARTPVSMTLVDIINDEDIFPEHESFKPERWINPPKTKDGSSLDRYFVFFQKGSRSCLGLNLAHAELYLAIAGIFRNFDFKLYQTDESDVKLAHDFFLPSPKLNSRGIRVIASQAG